MRIGIDLGGTKIAGIALADNGQELWRGRVATPNEDYRAIIETLSRLVMRIERETGLEGTLGVGTPGAISAVTGRMKNCNTVCLNGKSLKKDLQTRLRREVRIENDANCMALSEAVDGAATGKRVVFGVILGTGVGGGLVVNGQLLRGANGIAGEWGHNPLPHNNGRDSKPHGDLPARLCYCGKSDCIETFLCGAGLSRTYCELAGETATADVVVDLAKRGVTDAQRALDRYQHYLGSALSVVINIVDPDAIVLAGGLSNIDSLYKDIPLRWQDMVFSDRVDTPLLSARHGDCSGVRGAAWLWPVRQ